MVVALPCVSNKLIYYSSHYEQRLVLVMPIPAEHVKSQPVQSL